MLFREQSLQGAEASGVTFVAVEKPEIILNEVGNFLITLQQCGQAITQCFKAQPTIRTRFFSSPIRVGQRLK